MKHDQRPDGTHLPPEEATVEPSQTAQLAAAHRAYHLIHDRPPVLEDTVARWLLGPPMSVVLRVAPLRWLVFERLLGKVRPIRSLIVVRSRYAEDGLERVVGDGCRQYVILGAGLDSWALRHDSPGITVFELDHPATQRWKRDRILARLGAVPPHLVLVPIDFERESIAEVLRGRAFDTDSRAFVSWLGTIYYLTRDAIEATFASLATVCAPGSRVVFDYFTRKSEMSPADLELFELLDEGGTRRGEPLETLMNPVEVAASLSAAGFRVIEDVSAEEARCGYLDDRSDGLDIPDFARLCCAEREGAP